MPRPGEGLRPVLFNSGLAGAVSLPHRTHFLVLLFLTYVKLSMNSFLPPFRNIPAGVLPESECKGRDFCRYHQTSAHFFYAKKHFFRPKRGRTFYIMRARAKGERRGKRRAGRANGKRSPPPCLAESTRVLAAEYAAALRTATEREGHGRERHAVPASNADHHEIAAKMQMTVAMGYKNTGTARTNAQIPVPCDALPRREL